jgi:hypothetical protein
VDKIFIDYSMGKGYFRREIKVLELEEILKIFGSITFQSGGSPETRTRTLLPAADFESAASTVPPGSH